MKGFLIIVAAVFIACNSAFSQKIEKQVVWVSSLEGKEEYVQIKTDIVHDKITLVLSPSDSLFINGYRGFENIRNFEGNFILLFFGIRAGSDEEDARTVLICISNGHLYDVLDIHSFQNYLSTRTWSNKTIDSLGVFYESGTYKVDLLNIESDNKNGYRLNATEYHRVKSKQRPINNHENIDILHFSFDDTSKIFYNKKDTLNGSYLVGVSNKLRRFKGEKFPAIKIKNGEYFFIDGIWYMKGRENHLFTYNEN